MASDLQHGQGSRTEQRSLGRISHDNFVWLPGIGLVVAFRGTASYEDVLVDVNIAPTSLQLKSRQSPDGAATSFLNTLSHHRPLPNST